MALWVTAAAVLAPLCARGAESIDAEEFAKRCAQAQGHLAIDADLLVEGGSAEIAECRIQLGAARIDFRDVEFAAIGFLMIDGQADGEIRVERSLIIQSPSLTKPVNILLRAHHLRLDATTLDFVGTVHLETGAADRGQLHVESSLLRARAGDIHIGSSGRGRDGSSVMRHCELVAGFDGISILASAMAPRGAGRIRVEQSCLESPGPIVIQTGEEGRTRVHRNRCVSERGLTGIHAGTTVNIFSGKAGETTVDENRIVAEEEAAMSSEGRTRVRENNFVGSGGITIEGPSCEARRNVPDVTCSN